jgi:ribosomal-protein-alanine N-acetyltransferase
MFSAHDLSLLHGAAFTNLRPWGESEFADFQVQKQVIWNFAAVEDGLAGFILGRQVLDEVELLTIAVAPQHQRTGIGGKLIRQFLSQATVRGAKDVFLEVEATNTAAFSLYLAHDFVEVGWRKAYYHRLDGRVADAAILRKSL